MYERARQLYLPSPIRLIFITEAPPTTDTNRYFYFEKVSRGDSLFLELMKVLFPEEVAAFDTVKALRAEKKYFLERFTEAGFHLIHATDTPQPDTTATARKHTYRSYIPQLILQLQKLIDKKTPVVLISAVVHEACCQGLQQAGYTVLNKEMIEFPNSGQQINFRRKLSTLLHQHNLMPEGI